MGALAVAPVGGGAHTCKQERGTTQQDAPDMTSPTPKRPDDRDTPDVQERIRAARSVATEMLEERRREVQRDLARRSRELADEEQSKA